MANNFMPKQYIPSQACFDLIKKFEGCNLNAYKDPASGNLPITIGWGSTMYDNGNKIIMGDAITQQRADALLAWEVDNKAKAVNVPNDLKQCQFDAIVSFCYNLGIGTFDKSTLKKKVFTNPNDPTIKNEFMKYVMGGGKVMKGLFNRRQAEATLYFSD